MNLMDLMGLQAAQQGGGLQNLPMGQRAGLAMFGIGDILRGGSGTGAITMGSAFLGNQQEREKEEQARKAQEAADAQWGSLSGMLSGGQRYGGGTPPFNPVKTPTEPQVIGAETRAALGFPNYTPGDKESFVTAMWPHAQRVASETGLDPRLVIAQAAQETGWGKNAPNNNFFGIKSHDRSDGARLSTKEHVNGQDVTIQDSFRTYGGMGESAADYAQFLKENPRYRSMLSSPDLDGQVAALGQSGYATDPNYASSVGSIARSIGAPDTRTAQAGATDAPPPPPGLLPPQSVAGLEAILTNPNQPPERQKLAEMHLRRHYDAVNTQYTQQTQAQIGGAELPAAVLELQWRAEQAGLQPGTPEYQSFVLNGGGDPATYRALDMQARAAGLQPGTPRYEQFMASRGAYEQGYGRTTGQNVAEIETGGQAAATVAEGTERGKAAATAASELAEMQRNMPSLLTVADQLDDLAGMATYTKAGVLADETRKQLGMPPSEGAVARAEYIAVVDNQVLPLLRQTFGAAFTAKEGDTLRATLGDPDKSPSEKRAVLRSFIAQKERDLAARIGGTPTEATEGGDFRFENDAQRSLYEKYQ